MDRMLAMVCAVCPLCIVARRVPDSAWARLMRRLERGCPFCRAYRRCHAKGT